MSTFTQRKQELRLARGIRMAAIIVVLGAIAVAGEQLSITHRADAAPAATSEAVTTSVDYFPAQFAAPKGEPEPLPATF
jgi:hypothetical protein